MRHLALVAVLLNTLGSCDSEMPEPPRGDWALAECPSREEPGFVFFGETTIACVRGGELYEQDLDSLGYYIGSVESHYAYPRLTVVLQGFALQSKTYTIDLATGDVTLVGDAAAVDSRVVPVGESEFWTVDLLPAPDEPDSSLVSVRRHRDGVSAEVARGRIQDGGGRVRFIGADRAPSGDVYVLGISESAREYVVIRADGDGGTVGLMLVGDQRQLTGLFTDSASRLYVVESTSGDVFRVDGGELEPVWDLGAEPDDSQLRDVSRRPGAGFAVANRLAEGGVGLYDETFGPARTVGDGAVRFFAVREYEALGCGRAFPFFGAPGERYAETFLSVDVGAGVVRREEVTLPKARYDLPQVFCI